MAFFQRLPPEIRQLVYREIFAATPALRWRHKLIRTRGTGGLPGAVSSAVSVLLLSKQIRQEAEPILYQEVSILCPAYLSVHDSMWNNSVEHFRRNVAPKIQHLCAPSYKHVADVIRCERILFTDFTQLNSLMVGSISEKHLDLRQSPSLDDDCLLTNAGA